MLTLQLLFSTTPAAKCTKAPYKFLEINSTSTTIQMIKMSESVIEVTYSSSNIAIIRDANGFEEIAGIDKNSSRSIEPEPSLYCL